MTDERGTAKIDIGMVVQRGFSVIGRNAVGFLIVSLLLAGLPVFLIQFLVAAQADAANVAGLFVYPVLWLVSVVFGCLLQATLVRSSILTLDGQEPDVAGSLIGALGLVLPLIGLSILTYVGILLGLMLLIVPGIMLYIAWIVAVPVLIQEEIGVLASLKRSAELTRGSRWRIFGLICIYVVAYAILAGVGTVAGVAAIQGSPLAFAGTQALVSSLAALLASAMIASLYIELRTVREGATSQGLAAIFA